MPILIYDINNYLFQQLNVLFPKAKAPENTTLPPWNLCTYVCYKKCPLNSRFYPGIRLYFAASFVSICLVCG